jgi:SAM-dependent methyltransferase
MGLHNLVTLRRNLIRAVDTDSSVKTVTNLRDQIAEIKKLVNFIDEPNTKYIDNLVEHYTQVLTSITEPLENYQAQLEKINNEINVITKKLFEGNYDVEDGYGNPDNVRKTRQIIVSEDIENIIKQRLMLYTNWRYPSLEIGCCDGTWTQYMVAADPLYVVDKHEEFLTSTAGRFTPEYQRRLRQYHLRGHNLKALPQGQMSFVFSWSYFNFVSIDTMKQYLKQIYALLRPGGVFMFSYNDGDTPTGAAMAENFTRSYMPKSLLCPLLESIGFEIEKEFDFEPNISWLEIKKPGELHTNKAHQVMGEIKYINP